MFAGDIPPSDMWKLLVKAKYEQGSNEGDYCWHGASACRAVSVVIFLADTNAICRFTLEEAKLRASSPLPVVKANIIDYLDTDTCTRPLLKDIAELPIADIAAVEMIATFSLG
jgi:hypothetical protein